MDLVSNLSIGFGVAFTPINLLYCFVGVLLGTLIGVLPGIGPVATIAMLLPATYALPPVSALIMLAGIYYGAQYGGSTTAILVNLPGESSSVVTVIDGYQMAQAGPRRAGAGRGGSRFVLRGLRRHLDPRCIRRAAHGSRVQVRPRRILLADDPGADRRRGAGLRLADQGDRHDRPGPVDGPGRHRRQFGRGPLLVRHPGTDRRHRLHRDRHGRVRLRRDHQQPGQARGRAGSVHRQGDRALSDQGRFQEHDPGRAARHGAGLGAGHPARWGRAAVGVRRLHHRKEDQAEAGRGAVRQGQHPRRRGARVGQQRRLADFLHPAADAGHSAQRRDGADGRAP